MNNSVLVVVHPGYADNRHFTSDRYGSYDIYLSRLRDAVWSQSSIIFLYKRDKIPFELPSGAEVIRDPDRGYHTKRLISRLKKRRVDRIDICGEFLWWYGGNVNENLKRYSAKLPPEKRIQFENALERTHVLDSIRFAKRFGLDPVEFTKEIFFTGNEVNGGCVKIVYNEMKGEFPVEIRRELCYPAVDSP